MPQLSQRRHLRIAFRHLPKRIVIQGERPRLQLRPRDAVTDQILGKLGGLERAAFVDMKVLVDVANQLIWNVTPTTTKDIERADVDRNTVALHASSTSHIPTSQCRSL